MNLYLVNGFLGSGKTTAIANAAKLLISKKISTAIVTNDQGEQQVDSAYLRSLSLATEEISNGCFCCKYNDLEKTISSLKSKAKPETIFAESVGSCTDLVATVVKPFLQHHKDVRTIISVFADAYLMHSVMKGTSCFIEESVQYIYKKQLEDADIIVINKIDLLSKDELNLVKEMIAETYPGKKIICINAYSKSDILAWIKTLTDFSVPKHRKSLEIDYDIYGTGEAKLAWLDQKLSIHTQEPVAFRAAMVLMYDIYNRLQMSGYTIGHLKFLISDGKWHKKISYTTNGIKENLGAMDSHWCSHLDVLINARVQIQPQQLQQIITESIQEITTLTSCRIVTHKFAAFQPAFPKPIHRITA